MKHVRYLFVLVGMSLIAAGCKPNLPALAVKTSLPAGLIYSDFALYVQPTFRLVGQNGYASKLIGPFTSITHYGPEGGFIDYRLAMSFSDDGTRVLSFESSGNGSEIQRGDIVMQNLKTNARTQITNDPTHVNGYPRWWPGNANTILFSASPPGLRSLSTGHLGMVNVDGSDYRIYDDIAFTKAVPLADGKTLLYTSESDPTQVHVLTLGEPTRTLDPALYPSFMLNEKKGMADSPASCIAPDGLWSRGNGSPDGTLAAWSVCINEFTFINLQDPAQTFSITHDFSTINSPSIKLPVWSSDSQYFALAGSQKSDNTTVSPNSSILIFDRSGKLISQITRPDTITSQSWRPGTHELVYTLMPDFRAPPPGATPTPTLSPQSQPEVIIFNVDISTTTEINLPQPIGIHSWASLPAATK